MGKFFRWLKKKILRGSQSSSSSPARPGGDNKVIEEAIDIVVASELRHCPELKKFRDSIVYWQAVFKALAYAESGFNQYCRFVEPPSLGKDVVTGKQNTSEGLLQLSYQDSRYYSCEFNWEEDKYKQPEDKSKTIFNIGKNVRCGMAIMNKLVARHGHFVFERGNYWAVLKPNNHRHRVFLEALNFYLHNEV